MLMSLLPAFRDLRAPLVAGYVWLVAIWLIAERYLPNGAQRQEGAVGALGKLVNLTGRVGALAAATLIAYLIGSITESLMSRVMRRLSQRMRLREELPLLEFIFMMLTDNELNARALQGEAGYPSALSRSAVFPGESRRLDGEVHRLADSVVRQLDRIARRLRSDEKDLYDEFDRLRSEAELREALTPAVAALAVALAVTWDLRWLLLILLCLALLWQALERRASADRVVLDAILVKKVKAPALERIEQRGLALANVAHVEEHQDGVGSEIGASGAVRPWLRPRGVFWRNPAGRIGERRREGPGRQVPALRER
jgi:hypothetical protein